MNEIDEKEIKPLKFSAAFYFIQEQIYLV